jgi:hypothetical protein
MFKFESLGCAVPGSESAPNAEKPAVRAAAPFRKFLRVEKHWLAKRSSAMEFGMLVGMGVSFETNTVENTRGVWSASQFVHLRPARP